MELNPTHPVTSGLHENWHKVCAVLLNKLSPGKEVVVVSADLDALGSDKAVVCRAAADGLHLYVTTMAEAEKLAQQEEPRR